MIRRCAGFAMVEFALGSSVLLAGFAGCFELGYALIQYNRLETAVADAAQYASLVPYDSNSTTPSTTFLTSVRNMALYGSPTTGTSPVVNGLTANNVNLSVTFTNGVPSSVKVAVTGYTIYALFGSYTLVGKPAVTYPYRGVWAPA